jgi:hypothetical protein
MASARCGPPMSGSGISRHGLWIARDLRGGSPETASIRLRSHSSRASDSSWTRSAISKLNGCGSVEPRSPLASPHSPRRRDSSIHPRSVAPSHPLGRTGRRVPTPPNGSPRLQLIAHNRSRSAVRQRASCASMSSGITHLEARLALSAPEIVPLGLLMMVPEAHRGA